MLYKDKYKYSLINNIYNILIMTTIIYYKLKHASDETKKFYIGSTENIERRICGHKTIYNLQKKQLNLYSYIKSNGGWDAWTFEILEQNDCKDNEYRYIGRYIKEALLIEQHKAQLNTNSPRSYDPTDFRKQICGSCGDTLDISKTGKRNLQRHFETKKCQNATPPIIIRGKNNTINMTIANGRKRPVIIEGDDNTLNIHYPSTD